ncbi:MAG: hypothetical protein GF364_01055 [Candidatus Lokiarchaeota archaeon]|nr:hypothetical protein [Candidatus Lokiarchaeota archaeon]
MDSESSSNTAAENNINSPVIEEEKNETDINDDQIDLTTDELWQKTGFQRILGGYFYKYILNLAVMVFGLVVVAVIIPEYILPYPEALGFQSIVSTLFALMFTLFDVGIGSAVTRFVAEYVGRGEMKKTLEYIRFFIWFQMFTGLIQMSIIAIWGIFFASNMAEFAPMVWFFLINSCIQYPGMLGIYKSCLEAFQRYDRSEIIKFIQTVALESTTSLLFIMLGRWWGSSNPMIGDLMGATIGSILGRYIDDFFAMMLSAKFFADILKPYGISLMDTLVPHVSKDVAKNALIFGLKNMAQSIFYQISMLFMSLLQILYLPNYATIIGLMSVADTIARIIIQDMPTKASISEAYNNDKKNLTDYYIQSQFKWYGILTFYLTLEVGMLIPPAVGLIAANYAAAAWMVPYLLISRFFIPPIHFSDSVQQGADKPEYAAYSLFVQMVFRVIFFTLLIHPRLIPSLFDGYNYTVAYLLADLPSFIAKNIFAWWIIDRKIIKVKINVWQTIITPALALIPLIPLNFLFLNIFNRLATNTIIAISLALIFVMLILFVLPILILFPALGFLGGWDDRQLEHLKNAGKISGPSKFLVMGMYKTAKWCFEHTPLRKMGNKHKIPWKKADREAMELIKAREVKLLEDYSIKKSN